MKKNARFGGEKEDMLDEDLSTNFRNMKSVPELEKDDELAPNATKGHSEGFPKTKGEAVTRGEN